MVVASCGGGWTLRAGIGMTINLPDYPMSVTQCYLAKNDTHFIRVVYSFASFPSDWMWCLCLNSHCLWLLMCGYSGPSVVLRMYLLFLFWNRRLPSLEKSRVEHTHTLIFYFYLFFSIYFNRERLAAAYHPQQEFKHLEQIFVLSNQA